MSAVLTAVVLQHSKVMIARAAVAAVAADQRPARLAVAVATLTAVPRAAVLAVAAVMAAQPVPVGKVALPD